ncbi:MAG: hypothetical protein WCK51_04390 [Armatimonadota bacterium]
MVFLALSLLIQSTPINVESPGIRLNVLAVKLSQQAGLDVEIDPRLAEDAVAICVSGQPWSEVAEGLAEVVNGTWKQDGRHFRLFQTEQQQNIETSNRVKNLRSKLERLRARYASKDPMPVWSPEHAKLWLASENDEQLYTPGGRMSVNDSGPLGRLYRRVFSAVPIEEFIVLEPFLFDHRFSIGEIPNVSQFSTKTGTLISETKQELEILKKLMSEDAQSTDQLQVPAISLQFGEYGVQYLHSNLHVLRSDLAEPFYLTIAEGPETKPALEPVNSAAPNPWKSLGDELVDFGYGDREKHSPKFLALVDSLLTPESPDVTAYAGGGQDWLTIAKQNKKPVIALLAQCYKTDPVKSDAGFATDGPYRLDHNGWMLVSHRDLWRIRRQRISSAEFQRFLRLLKRVSEPNNDLFRDVLDQLEFRQWLIRTKLAHLESLYPPLLGTPHYPKPMPYDLIGACTPSDLALLRSGKPIQMDRLSPAVFDFFIRSMWHSSQFENWGITGIPKAKGISMTLRIERMPLYDVHIPRKTTGGSKPFFVRARTDFEGLASCLADTPDSDTESLISVAVGEALELGVTLTTSQVLNETSISSRLAGASKSMKLSQLPSNLLKRLRIRAAELKRIRLGHDDGR